MSKHARKSNRATLVGISVIVILTLAVIVFYRAQFVESRFDAIGVLTIVATLIVIYYVASPLIHRVPKAVPHGSVVAVVPSYNEESAAVHKTVWSLLRQTYELVEIHVVDDGSAVPLETFDHPKVFWHHQENEGKRFAQGRVFRQLRGRGFDYILTVDSDSEVEGNAVAKLLGAFTSRKIQAATGMVFVRNRGWLAKAADLQIVTWCLGSRMGQSVFGALNTTSGALSLYRAAVILDNLEDYLSSKHNDGDDRRLTHYALLRGKVVSVNQAIVYTDMPTSVMGMFKQRLRWSKSTWRFTLWEAANLPVAPLIFHIYFFVSVTLSPVIFAVLVVGSLVTGNNEAVAQTMVYLVLLGYLSTSTYVVARTDYALWYRLLLWLLVTPLLFLLSVTVMPASRWWALFKLRDSSWQTREEPIKTVDQLRYQ